MSLDRFSIKAVVYPRKKTLQSLQQKLPFYFLIHWTLMKIPVDPARGILLLIGGSNHLQIHLPSAALPPFVFTQLCLWLTLPELVGQFKTVMWLGRQPSVGSATPAALPPLVCIIQIIISNWGWAIHNRADPDPPQPGLFNDLVHKQWMKIFISMFLNTTRCKD